MAAVSAISVVSLAIRSPFTFRIARLHVDRDILDDPKRLNVVVPSACGCNFVVGGITVRRSCGKRNMRRGKIGIGGGGDPERRHASSGGHDPVSPRPGCAPFR